MKSVLVVSREDETFSWIHSCFTSTHRITRSGNNQGALVTLSKMRYDLVFIDITMLNESLQADGYKSALRSLEEVEKEEIWDQKHVRAC